VSFRLTQLPSLDGLRGIAILAVMLSNARYLPGGFLGVDIFFVLSEFLITAVLLQEWQRTGAIRLGAFYARRALRLLPALFALLARALRPPRAGRAIHRGLRGGLSLLLSDRASVPQDQAPLRRRGRGGAPVGPRGGPARSRLDPETNTAWCLVATDRA
jgi:hypothetical protein